MVQEQEPRLKVRTRKGDWLGWRSWGTWRYGQRLGSASQAQEPQGSRDFCFTCSGKGVIFEWARNGEGWIPCDYCPTCNGLGFC